MDKLALVNWQWVTLFVLCFLVVFVFLALLRRFGVEQTSKRYEDDHGSRLKAAVRAYGIKPWLANLIILSPIVLALVADWLLTFPPTPSVYSIAAEWIATGEHHPVEMLSFVFDLLAGILGLALVWQAKKRGDGLFVVGFYALFSIGMLFLAGEEVAWGQWIVGFDALPTPSWMYEMNDQGEITLHNMGSNAGKGGDLFRQAWGLGGILGVFLGVWRYSRQRFRKVAVPVILLPWFLVITIFASPLLDSIVPSAEQWRWPLDEVTEMMIGMAGFLFIWLNARMLSSLRKASSL
jgi:hypothetical protein